MGNRLLRKFRQIIGVVLSAGMIVSAAFSGSPMTAYAAVEGTLTINGDNGLLAEPGESIIVKTVDLKETRNETSGLLHSGLVYTKAELDNMRAQVLAGAEPWASYFEGMRRSYSSAQNHIDSITNDGAIGIFGNVAKSAWMNAMMYYITGDVKYRQIVYDIINYQANLTSFQTSHFPDSHIKMGIPVHLFCIAVELTRSTNGNEATNELDVTDEMVAKLDQNFLGPICDTILHNNGYYMNQFSYALMGDLAYAVLVDNKERYEQLVEWLTMNSDLDDKNWGLDGSIRGCQRLIVYDNSQGKYVETTRMQKSEIDALMAQAGGRWYIQNGEMGRDQPHAGGDVDNQFVCLRIVSTQGDKLDPVTGRVSKAEGAVEPIHFLDDRMIHGMNYYAKYNLGYAVQWTPIVVQVDGTGYSYTNTPNDNGRSRLAINSYADYYYTYKGLGYNLDEGENWYLKKAFEVNNAFCENNIRSGNYLGAQNWDFWIKIKENCKAQEGNVQRANYILQKELPRLAVTEDQTLLEVEKQFIDLDTCQIEGNGNPDAGKGAIPLTVETDEDGTSYIRAQIGADKTKTVTLTSIHNHISQTKIGMRVRTNGPVTLDFHRESDYGNYPSFQTIQIPDTGDKWTYVILDLSSNVVSSSQYSSTSLLYIEAKGHKDGTHFDFDSLTKTCDARNITSVAFEGGQGAETLQAAPGLVLSKEFSAGTSGTGTISYSSYGLPEGTALDENTGTFSWTVPAGSSESGSFLVYATDGVTVTGKVVEYKVNSDVSALVEYLKAQYDSTQVYTRKSDKEYKAALEEAEKLLESGSTDQTVLGAAVQKLQEAVDGLELLNIELTETEWQDKPEGSHNLDFISMAKACWDSKTGDSRDTLPSLADSNFITDWGLLLIDSPERDLVMDFGVDYAVDLQKAKIHATQGFPYRMANVVLQGSNDKVEWTNLTNQLASDFSSDEWTDLNVEAAETGNAYRYIKIHSYGGDNVTQVAELRLFGSRVEHPSMVSDITMTATDTLGDLKGGLGKLAKVGSTVSLQFTAEEGTTVESVTIHGQTVELTQDGNKYSAKAKLEETGEYGEVPFLLTYSYIDSETKETKTESKKYTTDESFVYLLANGSQIDVASLISSGEITESHTGGIYGSCTFDKAYDGKNDTWAECGSANNECYWQLNFGEGKGISGTGVRLLGRQDDRQQTRIRGVTLAGSNDGQNWEILTDDAFESGLLWQALTVKGDKAEKKYQYLRFTRADNSNWAGNIAEFTLYGEIGELEKAEAIETVSLATSNAESGIAVTGDTVTLSFTASEELKSTSVYLAGQKVEAKTSDNKNFTASMTIGDKYTLGEMPFRIDYETKVGQVGKTVFATTDGSTVTIKKKFAEGELDLRGLLSEFQGSFRGAWGTSSGKTIQQVGEFILDVDASTNPDIGTNEITLYLGENKVKLEKLRIQSISRTDNCGRANGVIFRGSVDGESWDDLTEALSGVNAVSTWYDAEVKAEYRDVEYSYIKMINPTNTGFNCNVAELEAYGTKVEEKEETGEKLNLKGLLSEFQGSFRQGWGTSSGKTIQEVGEFILDEDASTNPDIGTNEITLYLGENKVSLTKLRIQSILNGRNVGRANGVIFQGSADGTSWDTLTDPLSGVSEVSTWYDAEVKEEYRDVAYSYIKMVHPDSNTQFNCNVAELEAYGKNVEIKTDTDTKTGSLTAPASINNIAGTKFSVQVKVNGLEEGTKLIQMVMEVPEALEVADVKMSDTVSGGSVQWNSETVEGKKVLRAAYGDLAGYSNISTTESEEFALFTVDFELKEKLQSDAVLNLVLKDLGYYLNSDSYKPYEISGSNEVDIKTANAFSVSVKELYTGDGVDIIPADAKAVKVAVTGLEEGFSGSIVYKKGNTEYTLFSSKDFTEQDKVASYLLIVPSETGLDELGNAEDYVTKADASTEITFGDLNYDGNIDAQDALKEVCLWLRKAEESRAIDDRLILTANVNSDARINNADALAIVEHFISGATWKTLMK